MKRKDIKDLPRSLQTSKLHPLIVSFLTMEATARYAHKSSKETKKTIL